MHYYNENDPKAAAWLQELINAGHIPQGHVDERSITTVSPTDLRGYRQCHFFAGIGGWPLALQLAGVSPDTPLWTGSCPCQPFSNAGKRLGTDDERHLWPVWAKLIEQCKPPTVFGEQVASKSGRAWLCGVRAQMETMGYAVGAADLCAAGVSSPQIRQRLWWVGYTRCCRHERRQHGGESPAPTGSAEEETRQRQRGRHASGGAEQTGWADTRWHGCSDGRQRRIPTQPSLFPLADGLSRQRVAILRGCGNAIVPQVAAEFIKASQEAIQQLT